MFFSLFMIVFPIIPRNGFLFQVKYVLIFCVFYDTLILSKTDTLFVRTFGFVF